MKRTALVLICLVLLVILLCVPLSEYSVGEHPNLEEVEITNTPTPSAKPSKVNTNASIYCWNRYVLCEGSYGEIGEFFGNLKIKRVYQAIPEMYFARSEIANMAELLGKEGIEVVVLQGDPSWGLAEDDLSGIKKYIDKIAQYNSDFAVKIPLKKIALDIETYSYSEWSEDPRRYFAEYIEQMRVIYEYAHAKGFEVVQVIPANYDKIDVGLFRKFVETCADEISIMNYRKNGQLTAIDVEVDICRELGKPIETIFETMPYSDNYEVTENITYFYDGFDVLKEVRDEILQKYNYEKLTVSYHHFPTVYHVAEGKYMAEIYAYTNKEDPARNELGQSEELDSIILTGDDGSVIKAGLYNPNIGREYEESCYFVLGIQPDVRYTISSVSEKYTIDTPEMTFSFEEEELIDYKSIRIRRVNES